jgi:DNA-binding CsgD family transcriptional regulator
MFFQDKGISSREMEIITMIINKKQNEIADKLSLFPHTVKNHIKNIYMKLNVHSRDELIKLIEDSLGMQLEDSKGGNYV